MLNQKIKENLRIRKFSYYLIVEQQCGRQNQPINQEFLNEIIFNFQHNNQKKMESIFEKLDGIKNFKEQLRYWCRQNGIKISFTVNMTLTKSKAIFRKLENTYKKGFGKAKARWLENQLKLFHFALLAVSLLYQIKIADFSQQQWQFLIEAFPSKLQPILEYEAKNFTANKNQLKQKWGEDEDRLLTEILQKKTEQPKWNQVATQLYIDSNRLFFRNGKQCRQRWLNHLDTDIKHQKWTNEEDLTLIRSVLQHGKKWSKIMRCLNNQRTEHMIKNRFLSLILKCKKAYPFIQDQESAIKKISQEMGLSSEDSKAYQDQLYSERKLRPKTTFMDRIGSLKENSEEEIEENSYKISIINVQPEKKSEKNQFIKPEYSQHSIVPPSMESSKFSCATLSTPSSTAFISPVSFINCNPFFSNFGYFQYYMNDFYNHLGTTNFSNQE